MSSSSANVVALSMRHMIPEPKDMLDLALKRIRRKNGHVRVVNQWPSAKDVSVRVIAFLTDRMPDANGDPLVLRCLREAVDCGQDFMRSNPGVAMDPELFALFLIRILSPCVEVLQHRVSCQRTGLVWDPLQEDLWQFLQRCPFVTIHPSEILSHEAIPEFFSSLVERLVSDEDLNNIRRSRERIVLELLEVNRCLFLSD